MLYLLDGITEVFINLGEGLYNKALWLVDSCILAKIGACVGTALLTLSLPTVPLYIASTILADSVESIVGKILVISGTAILLEISLYASPIPIFVLCSIQLGIFLTKFINRTRLKYRMLLEEKEGEKLCSQKQYILQYA